MSFLLAPGDDSVFLTPQMCAVSDQDFRGVQTELWLVSAAWTSFGHNQISRYANTGREHAAYPLA